MQDLVHIRNDSRLQNNSRPEQDADKVVGLLVQYQYEIEEKPKKLKDLVKVMIEQLVQIAMPGQGVIYTKAFQPQERQTGSTVGMMHSDAYLEQQVLQKLQELKEAKKNSASDIV